MEPSVSKSAEEIALEFSERFQNNYPAEPLWKMMDDMRKEIENYHLSRLRELGEEKNDDLKAMLDMKLHDEFVVKHNEDDIWDTRIVAIRVPGGWIYKHSQPVGELLSSFTCTFVPLPSPPKEDNV